MTSSLKTWAAASAALLGLTGTAHATLYDRGGGMIYDSTRNITWLADMNYAKTSGYDSDGLMTWSQATAWANNLVFGGYDDWRLPTLNPSDTSCSNSFNPGGGYGLQYYGYNCTGGELSGLFVSDLGNRANESVLTQTGDTAEQITNLALFSNVQSVFYWSGTEYAPDPSLAWGFNASIGYQRLDVKVYAFNAVAVRPGDVAAVPEPQPITMLLTGLGVLLGAVKRRTR